MKLRACCRLPGRAEFHARLARARAGQHHGGRACERLQFGRFGDVSGRAASPIDSGHLRAREATLPVGVWRRLHRIGLPHQSSSVRHLPCPCAPWCSDSIQEISQRAGDSAPLKIHKVCAGESERSGEKIDRFRPDSACYLSSVKARFRTVERIERADRPGKKNRRNAERFRWDRR